MSEFLMDVKKIRTEAARSMEDGAMTEETSSDREQIVKMLDSALATEWICVLRYTQHSIAATGIHARTVAGHFTEHAREELEHAHLLAERIKQLGENPKMDPAHLTDKSHSQYKECESVVDMIKENLIAERIAILSYAQMIRFVGDKDITSRRLLEEILEKEEEHADEMADLLDSHDIK